MDIFSLTSTITIEPSVTRFFLPRYSQSRRLRNLSLPQKAKKFIVFASNNVPNLDKWDRMELKFGQLLGEDPKLTLAKILARKSNPDMTCLETEKLFDKGKIINSEIEEVPFDGSRKEKSPNSQNGLNLIRPVPKKGVKFESNDKAAVSGVKKPNQPVVKTVDTTRSSIPNVILRKPTVFNEDNMETEKSSRLRIKPNLSLRVGKEHQKERFSDMTLLKKPEPAMVKSSLDEKKESSTSVDDNSSMRVSVSTGATENVALLEKPELINPNSNADQEPEPFVDLTGLSSGTETGLESADISKKVIKVTKTTLVDHSIETGEVSVAGYPGQKNDSVRVLQMLEQNDTGFDEKSSASREPLDTTLANTKISIEAALRGKPKRLDHSVKGTSNYSREETVPVNNNREETIPVNPESYGNIVELENFLATSPIKEHEDIDWTKAEDLIKTRGREDVEIISSSTRGFVVSFGSLLGFLPYRNLPAKWKFLAFESWLRRKGLDPSMYKQSLGIIGSYEAANKATNTDSSLNPQTDSKVEGEISPDMKIEDLLRIYDQEKLIFLSSFVGQKIRVNVVMAHRQSRRLIFSVKPKEKEESVEKKRSLMAKLSVGDVVKCCIKKITFFGIFVEVEGVPALIHQTEVSWDATLDPESYFKIGQIVEAKVHQLDFSLQRIFLSLKEITPDPLIEALEAVVGDHDSLDGRLEDAQADTEWADVESLVKELQQFEGIQSVTKGRYFLSPGLTPTFQVYMASMFENQYKLLARAGNRVREVIVQTSLSKDQMKSAILTCTNRVE